MKPTKENTLYLPIKQVFFDQIVAGTKKEEYREIKDTTYKKYLECDKDGWPFYDLSKAEADNPLLGDLCIWNDGVISVHRQRESGIPLFGCRLP